ncbi:MFS transporter [Vibrio lentus]|uniref:MFS transporter n=1 Tax=Vibrio lentus TaxID=136468 RepID=UPI000C8501D0|nr:MFS transporter [Vibrio lentus]PMI80189.1 hypothetical protein BCU36_17080 [Vibrio lentus]
MIDYKSKADRYFVFLGKLSPQGRGLLPMALLVPMSMFALNPYFVTHLPEYLHVSATIISAALTMAFISGALISIAVSKILKNHQLVVMGRIALALLAMSVLALFSLQWLPYWIQILCVVIFLVIVRASLNISTIVSRSIQIQSNSNSVNRGALFSLITTLFSLGAAIGPVLGEVVIGNYSFSHLLLVVGLVLTINFFINYKFVKPIQVNDSSIIGETKTKYELGAILICVNALLVYFIYGLSFSFFPLLLKGQSLSYTEDIRDFFLVYAIYRIFLPVIVNKLIVRFSFGCYAVLFLGTLFIVVGVVLLTENIGSSYFGMMILVFALGEILVGTYGLTLLGEIVKVKSSTTAHVGLFTLCTSAIGLGGGQLAGTIVYENFLASASIIWIAIGLMAFVPLILAYKYIGSRHEHSFN